MALAESPLAQRDISTEPLDCGNGLFFLGWLSGTHRPGNQQDNDGGDGQTGVHGFLRTPTVSLFDAAGVREAAQQTGAVGGVSFVIVRFFGRY